MIEVYFDGACEPNPYGRIGYGAIIFKDAKKVYEICKEYKCAEGTKTTNNMAEYCAAYAALKYLIHKNWQHLPIIFRGDSKLVINQLSGEWQIGKGAYIDIACKTKDLLKHFAKIEFAWFPRVFNDLADKLSRKAIGLS
jgi:ribonuclease HI